MTAPAPQLDLSQAPAGLSLSARIAETLAAEIRRGRFGPGQKLPGSRRLSEQLGVHRNTVLAAIADLNSQGYVRTEPGRGVFVSQRVESRPSLPRRRSRCAPVDFPLALEGPENSPWDVRPGDLPLLGGLPDLRLFPIEEFARAYRSALRRAPQLLDYRSDRGEPRFLEVFARFLSETRGVVTRPGELFTTRGSQQALYLAAKVLCAPGRVIAVEALGYPPAWEAFRLAGARLHPVRVDQGGLDIADLARVASEEDVAAVYVTPHHQYPTTATMSGPRRSQLLALAQQKRFFIIEDDYDHEFHFEGRPVLPLASFDEAQIVVHVGTFSKVFAPGLRLGYVAAQARVIDAMARVRRVIDRQGDHVAELALSHLIEDGAFGAHLRRMHRVYRERREVLFVELAGQLSGQLSFTRPRGGLAVWTRVRGPERAARSTVERWVAAARERGVLVQAGRDLSFDKRPEVHLRLGYPRLNPAEIREAVTRLSAAYRAVCGRG